MSVLDATSAHRLIVLSLSTILEQQFGRTDHRFTVVVIGVVGRDRFHVQMQAIEARRTRDTARAVSTLSCTRTSHGTDPGTTTRRQHRTVGVGGGGGGERKQRKAFILHRTEVFNGSLMVCWFVRRWREGESG